MRRFSLLFLLLVLSGCSAIPDVAHQPQFHNPFPQVHRVAVLPFFNQSAEPTVDQDQIALAYFNELQAIRGFEVMPVGVAKQLALSSGIQLRTGEDFQRLARQLGVDAIVVGSVTEYSPYYPPRLGLTVRWYAANPNFHPIPAGYGLPWGTAEEEFIPSEMVFEAEFALAKEQLATQSPLDIPMPLNATAAAFEQPAETEELPAPNRQGESVMAPSPEMPVPGMLFDGKAMVPLAGPELPPDWPDPRGFVPPPPSPHRPVSVPQSEPIMSLT
jgi:hypothetical protein